MASSQTKHPMKPDADGLITELRQTLGKMEVALGAIADAIAWTDEDGRIQWCNVSFDRLVGRRHIEVLESKFIDLVPLACQGQGVLPENHPLSMILKGPTSASGIYEFQQADRRLVLDISGRYIRLPEHQASAIIMIRDITELSKAKELLEQESRALVKFPDENPNPVLRATTNGTVLYANKAGLALLKLWKSPTGEVVPDFWRSLIVEAISSGSTREIDVMCGEIVYYLNFAPLNCVRRWGKWRWRLELLPTPSRGPTKMDAFNGVTSRLIVSLGGDISRSWNQSSST